MPAHKSVQLASHDTSYDDALQLNAIKPAAAADTAEHLHALRKEQMRQKYLEYISNTYASSPDSTR